MISNDQAYREEHSNPPSQTWHSVTMYYYSTTTITPALHRRAGDGHGYPGCLIQDPIGLLMDGTLSDTGRAWSHTMSDRIGFDDLGLGFENNDLEPAQASSTVVLACRYPRASTSRV